MKKEHQTQIETRNWIANPFRAFKEEFTLSLSRQSTKKVFKCGTKITSDYWKKFQTFGELDISKWGCEICRSKAWIIEKEVQDAKQLQNGSIIPLVEITLSQTWRESCYVMQIQKEWFKTLIVFNISSWNNFVLWIIICEHFHAQLQVAFSSYMK